LDSRLSFAVPRGLVAANRLTISQLTKIHGNMSPQTSGLDTLLSRREPSAIQKNWSSPLRFLAKALYALLEPAIPVPKDGIHIVCISDTHNTRPELPKGDVLLHAGDLTQSGSLAEVRRQIDWLDSQPHKFKVVIAGNHDLCLDSSKAESRDENDKLVEIDWRSLTYLEDTSTTLRFKGGRQLKIYGSPWTPKHGNWAVQYPRTGKDPWKESVPEDTDILLTHGPPKHHLDLGRLGCSFLLQELHTKTPLLQVFGHIHAGYGCRMAIWDSFVRRLMSARSIADDGSWPDLVRMLIFSVPRIRQTKQGGNRSTVMVNASAVGGFRDEETRQAITVII
jgi:predicted phosphohydrolase